MEGYNTSSVISIRNEQSGTEMTKLLVTTTSLVPSSHVPQATIHVASTQPRFPSPHLLHHNHDARKKYLGKGVALYNAALSADWEAADRIINEEPTILTASISIGGLSVLHLASGAGCPHFVNELVTKMSCDDLELRDAKGNTPLCFAASTGTVPVAEILLKKNPGLATMRGGHGMTPLYMAALFGNKEMALFLYKEMGESCNDEDRKGVFFSCIYTGIYDLAYELVKHDVKLAIVRDKNNKTALHHLAQTPEAFTNQISGGWSNLLKSCVKLNRKKKMKRIEALDLVQLLWSQVLILGHDEAMDIVRIPEMLFDATKAGNCDFIFELIKSYPDLAWEHDDENRTIIHYAIMYRQANIFNIIHDIGPIKEIIATYDDSEENHLLHLAAKLPPNLDRLNTVSGPALQMQQELLWFQEVKKIVQPTYVKKGNTNKEVAEQLFSVEHKPLRQEGEKFMKNTASSGMVVSALITTVVFAAIFTLPGGSKDTVVPNDIKATSFMFFVLSDGLAFISSVVSIMMFLSILTSRYAESDFKKSLPLKLMIGLASLFFSLMTMVVAFSSAVFIACNYGIKWVPFLISILALIPIILFVVLQFPLLIDTFSSTYWSRTEQFQSSKRVLY